MNLNEAITNNGENLLSLTTGEMSQDGIGNQLFKFDKLSDSLPADSVNNYFKSMKEIETEFITSMNAAKTTLKNMLIDLSQFGQNLIYMDGDVNFPDPDDIHHGYMEENY